MRATGSSAALGASALAVAVNSLMMNSSSPCAGSISL
jgi:hypothetical protein